jgi:hypothetical protein
VADGLVALADLDRFPGRVLLGVVNWGEGHMVTFCCSRTLLLL